MTTYTFADPPPFAHQMEGVRRAMETRGRLALLCEPGTGKTRIVLDYAAMLAAKYGEARVLIVAPVAALDTWVKQAAEFVPDDVDVWAEVLEGSIKRRGDRLSRLGGPNRGITARKHPESLLARLRSAEEPSQRDLVARGPDALATPRLVLAVTNLETFSSRRQVTASKTALDVVLEGVKDYRPDLVVVDESHRIKSGSSNVSRAMARVREHAPRRMILTGTPMPHSPLDVYGQWRFLAPEVFSTKMADGSVRPWSFGVFKQRYARLGGYLGKEVVGFQRLDELEDKMAEHSLVVRKADALDLPPTTDVTVPVHLSTRERRTYEQMKAELAVEFARDDVVSAPNALAQMMRLRQITSGYLPRPEEDGGDVEIVGTSKVDAARSLVTDLLTTERRVVVFAHFIHEIKALRHEIERAEGKRTEVVAISGATPTAERKRLRERFGDLTDGPERMVIVAQMRTLSLAVNELVTASHAVFASLSERRDDYVQARDRLDRVGQTAPVTFWHLVAPATVDEVLLLAHRDRTSLETAMLRHVRGEREDAATAVA